MSVIERIHKNRLQEYCQKRRLRNPTYHAEDHEPSGAAPGERWTAKVTLDYSPSHTFVRITSRGWPQKGDAEQEAAKILMEWLMAPDFNPDGSDEDEETSTTTSAPATPTRSASALAPAPTLIPTLVPPRPCFSSLPPANERLHNELISHYQAEGLSKPTWRFFAEVVLPTGAVLRSRGYDNPWDADQEATKKALAYSESDEDDDSDSE